MKGAGILVQTLIEQGVTDVFGYPGGRVVDIYDALFAAGDKIRHILTAHEQGAAHAADGFARVSGKPGVVIATSGPGATNLVTGIATAMLDSVPMVAITGNVSTALIGKDAFQEVNITGVTMPITKHNYFVSDVAELADTVREAFALAQSGRPGPVLIDIPQDVQRAECDFVPAAAAEPLPHKAPKAKYIQKAATLIHKAKRPYFYVGGGAVAAGVGEEIMALAEKTDAYIGCSLMGLSVFPHRYARYLGMEGMHGNFAASAALRDADVIIAIGVRFSDRATGKAEKFAENTAIIHLDTDLAEINKNVPAAVGIVGDLKEALSALSARVKQKQLPKWAAHIEALREKQAAIEAASDSRAVGLQPKKVIEIINRYKTDDTVIATDVGQHQMWTAQTVDLEKPRRFITSGGLGTMGYGLGAAIGASVATGGQSVLITGDGSFGMNLNELATAVTYHIPVVIVVMNNGVLGMVRQWQTFFFEGHYASTTLERKTDFVALAKAFGAAAGRAATPEAFEELFRKAMAAKAPFVIEIGIDKDELVLPMLPSGGSIRDLITSDPREETK